MIAEAGLAALWLAAAFAAMQAFLGLGAVRDRLTEYARITIPLAWIQALLTLFAFVCLIMLFLRTDLSVWLVATNSHVDKPWLFKLAATWGNHEGSMLLWVTILSVAGAALALFGRSLDAQLRAVTLGAQALLSLGFFAFLLFSSNPFRRIAPAAKEGLGLNPLLQDPGLAFHPPPLYLGYVGLSVAFSFAVAALLLRQVGPDFARAMRPWVLGAWIWLTVGIVAGSYWAYYELGWGGWWFWDPVENASLMPWIAATALLHSVSVLANRDALRSWTIMLALIGFAMSMVGTFLVRSGILTSVHSFAVDPERGSFILALLVIYVGAAFTLFGLRIGTVRQGEGFHLFSREAGLVVNNLLLSAILAVVMVGTLYPLFAELVFGAKISVGPPYFNSVSIPMALALLALLIVGPLLGWRKDGRSGLLKKVAPSIAAGLAVLVLMLVFAPDSGFYPIVGLSFAGALVPASVMPLALRGFRAPAPVWGMALAHLGVAVSVAGMASESAFTIEKLAAMRVGDEVTMGDWRITLEDVEPVLGDNWTAIEARLTAQRGDSTYTVTPQLRQFLEPNQETSEAALLNRWDGQIYAVIGPQAGEEPGMDSRWQMRFWWKPFVALIWLGGLLVAFGGFVSLVGRAVRPLRAAMARRREQKEPGFA